MSSVDTLGRCTHGCHYHVPAPAVMNNIHGGLGACAMLSLARNRGLLGTLRHWRAAGHDCPRFVLTV